MKQIWIEYIWLTSQLNSTNLLAFNFEGKVRMKIANKSVEKISFSMTTLRYLITNPCFNLQKKKPLFLKHFKKWILKLKVI